MREPAVGVIVVSSGAVEQLQQQLAGKTDYERCSFEQIAHEINQMTKKNR